LSAASNPERADAKLRRLQPHQTPRQSFLKALAIRGLLLSECGVTTQPA
jgi:hypothetical protein